MFSAEAARLAAIEVLSPTAANVAKSGFPTLAGGNYFDSQSAPLSAIDRDRDFTPVVAVYTREVQSNLRGEAAAGDDHEVKTLLEFVVELASVAQDADGEFADAIEETDPKARLTLAALVSQISHTLRFSAAGYLFRRSIIRVDRVEAEGHAVPQLGLRFQRVFLRFHLIVRHDQHSAEGGLPEPTKTIAALLPDGSYAKNMLEELGAHFAGASPVPLKGIAIFDGVDADPSEDVPIATIGEIDDDVET